MAGNVPGMTRMVILWLLSEGPLHGYRIRSILEDEALNFWFPIDPGSIYTVLRTLAKNEYIAEVAVEQEGLRPQRTKYRITRAGRKHLAALLEEAWRQPPGIGDPMQMALAAQSELDKERVDELFRERVGLLAERVAALEAVARSAPAPEMVARQLALTKAELDWAKTQTKRR
jgi:DNA-binding PadR family transcriptional regulator